MKKNKFRDGCVRRSVYSLHGMRLFVSLSSSLLHVCTRLNAALQQCAELRQRSAPSAYEKRFPSYLGDLGALPTAFFAWVFCLEGKKNVFLGGCLAPNHTSQQVDTSACGADLESRVENPKQRGNEKLRRFRERQHIITGGTVNDVGRRRSVEQRQTLTTCCACCTARHSRVPSSCY